MGKFFPSESGSRAIFPYDIKAVSHVLQILAKTGLLQCLVFPFAVLLGCQTDLSSVAKSVPLTAML